jgi:hypothetical protein
VPCHRQIDECIEENANYDKNSLFAPPVLPARETHRRETATPLAGGKDVYVLRGGKQPRGGRGATAAATQLRGTDPPYRELLRVAFELLHVAFELLHVAFELLHTAAELLRTPTMQ